MYYFLERVGDVSRGLISKVTWSESRLGEYGVRQLVRGIRMGLLKVVGLGEAGGDTWYSRRDRGGYRRGKEGINVQCT